MKEGEYGKDKQKEQFWKWKEDQNLRRKQAFKIGDHCWKKAEDQEAISRLEREDKELNELRDLLMEEEQKERI